jgi:hypothetical protein
VREQLEGWGPSSTRRKAAANKVSLILLVDKTLDLASCVRYGGDSLLARATEMLRRRLFGIKTWADSTLETAMKDYTGDNNSLLISLSTVSCLAQERNIRRKRMQALAGQFARVNCEGGERVFGYLTDLVRGRMDNSLSLVNTVWERLEGMKSSR